MFKNIARTLTSIALATAAIAPRQHVPIGKELSQRELSFYGRGKGGKTSSKKGNAAQLKRAATKRNNIRKHG